MRARVRIFCELQIPVIHSMWIPGNTSSLRMYSCEFCGSSLRISQNEKILGKCEFAKKVSPPGFFRKHFVTANHRFSEDSQHPITRPCSIHESHHSTYTITRLRYIYIQQIHIPTIPSPYTITISTSPFLLSQEPSFPTSRSGTSCFPCSRTSTLPGNSHFLVEDLAKCCSMSRSGKIQRCCEW